MTMIILECKNTAAMPASGAHLEALGDAEQAARALLNFIELERTGTFDDVGANFWVGLDPLLGAAERILALVKQSRAELKDAPPLVAINKGGDPYPPLYALMSLCEKCHNTKTRVVEQLGREFMMRGCDIHGYPLDPNHPFYRGGK